MDYLLKGDEKMLITILDFLMFITLCVCVYIDYKKFYVSKLTLSTAFLSGCCFASAVWSLCEYLGV